MNIDQNMIAGFVAVVVLLIALVLFSSSAVSPGMSKDEFEQATLHRRISYILFLALLVAGGAYGYMHYSVVSRRGEMGCGCGDSCNN